MPRPIHIIPGPTGWVLIKLPYSPERVEKMRTIPTRKWDDTQKCWAIPKTARTINRLKALFSGDQIIIDPELLGHKPTHPGQRPPLRVAPGSAHDTVRSFAEKLRKEAYSPHTIKIYTRHAARLLKKTRLLPADITSEHIEHYLQNLKNRERASNTYHNQAIRALKAFCKLGLHKSDAFLKAAFPPRKKPREEA
ncbi:MAG: phage integrase N-terminal SAM-like domain-containing protein [Candidatus Latescibacteria bacterium]|nr:phage integrase N-terminal SAM-like domain-containing protein [Candidatus Latescibacterota bacterium]